MSIDRGDVHLADAKTWQRACRHMGLFLWWAAERGLASETHDVSEIRLDPTEHFISACDCKLWEEDLTERGNAFAQQEYGGYLDEVGAYAKVLGVGDYEIAQSEATTKHFFAWLDGRLAAFPS